MNTTSLLYIVGAVLIAALFMMVRRRIWSRVLDSLAEKQRATAALLFDIIAVATVIGLFVYGLTSLQGSAQLIAILITVVSGAFIFTSEGWIQDAFAGVGLQMSKSYEVGDLVTLVGERGRVISLGLFRTELETFGLDIVSLRNSQILQGNVVNHSGRPFRRIDMIVHTAGYGEFDQDIDGYIGTVRAIARDVQKKICPEALDNRKLLVPVDAFFIEFGSSSDFVKVVFYTYDKDEVYDAALSAMHMAMARELRPRGVVLGQVNANTIENVLEYRRVES
jgi:small conductance mechanosensitive channel